MKKISDYVLLAEDAIKNLKLEDKRPIVLYEPIHYAMQSGGKRLRPAIVMMACEGYGEDAANALYPAVGLEMFHNFTLLHDDVMDNSGMRRGRSTVCAKYGVNAAILSGDTMLTLATQLINEVDKGQMPLVQKRFNDMAIAIYEGQASDMEFEERQDVTLDEYIDMTSKKTGDLLGCAAAIGAIIGGATQCDCDKLYQMGINLGIAFQIQDDYLDVFGDSLSFGKAIGGDINNGKKTYLYHCVNMKGEAASEALQMAMRLPSGDAKVKTMIHLYEKYGAVEDCKAAVSQYTAIALKLLKSTKMSDEGKESFYKLAEKLTGRKK